MVITMEIAIINVSRGINFAGDLSSNAIREYSNKLCKRNAGNNEWIRTILLQIFKSTGALLEGHFVLTSGRHSATYFQCAKVLQYPEYLTLFGREITDYFEDYDIDTVISPAIGGVVIGTEVGRQLGVKTIFTERKDGEMKLRRGFEIEEGENILIVEDVINNRWFNKGSDRYCYSN